MTFRPAVSVLAIQGVGLGAMFVSVVWGNGLLSLGVYRLILAINIAALAFNALIVSALIPLDGSRGAAIGTAIAEVVAAIGQAAAVCWGRPALRPSLRIVPRVALAAAAGLTPLALTPLPTIARLALSTALFGAVALLTRAFPPELLDLLRTVLVPNVDDVVWSRAGVPASSLPPPSGLVPQSPASAPVRAVC